MIDLPIDHLSINMFFFLVNAGKYSVCGEKKANIVPHDKGFASESFIDNLLAGDLRGPLMDHQVVLIYSS